MNETTQTMPDAMIAAPPPADRSTDVWQAAVEAIERAGDIMLICHVAPDGDAIGSMLGLGLALQTLGKAVTMACQDPPPAKFNFLHGYEEITSTVKTDNPDLIIGLDSSDPARMGTPYDPDRFVDVPLINIDHHITNLYYADINLVVSDAASTAEIICTLLDRLGMPVDGGATPHAAEIATCLLTGIVTDTVGFRTANVTPPVMHAAMRLMNAGASLAEVTHFSFNQRPLAELRLLGRALGRLQAQDGLAWTDVTLVDRQTVGLDNNGDAGLAGMLVRTQEVHIAATFTEKENSRVEVSLRAAPGFDVSQIALSLGGGGHAAASGCTIEGPLEAVKARVLPMLRAALEQQRQQ